MAQIDFEEFLPLTVWGLRAQLGDGVAAGKLETFRQRLVQETARLRPGGGSAGPPPGDTLTDSWSHYQRRACALAEVYALALERRPDALSLLQLAQQTPKGFAGFRAFSALTLAETAELVSPGDQQRIDAALESAQAASHRIQDYAFCLRATAIVNAIGLRWRKPPVDLETTVAAFSSNPLTDDFCAVHRVWEDFPFRNLDHFQSLPIPETVLNARTPRQIAGVYWLQAEQLMAVNSAHKIDDALSKNDTVNIPEPVFTPILAARLSGVVLAAPGLTDERRSALIQRLVPLTISNRTALDTVLARLLLSARRTKFEMPGLLASLEVPSASDSASSAESLIA